MAREDDISQSKRIVNAAEKSALIHLVQKNSILWHLSSGSFKNRQIKNSVWVDIQKKLNVPGILLVV